MMKREQYYFMNDDDECCYTLSGVIDRMNEEGIKEMKVFKAVRVTNIEYFWCKKEGEVGEVGECCGKSICDHYVPNNGKNGRCKYYGYLYEPAEEKIIKL